MKALSRREFIQLITRILLAASGLLGLGVLIRLLEAPTSSSPLTQHDLGPASNFPLGSRTVIPAVPATLLHSQVGFSALSLSCTHLGCTLEPTAEGFTCPCHGSQFDVGGHPQRGPATNPLTVFRVEQDAAGRLILFND